MATSSWLLSVLTFVHCAMTVLSVSCNLPDEKSETSCFSKISEGIKCQGDDSEMQKCYKQCEQFASAYVELGQQAKVFEQVVCDKGLKEKVMAQQDCAKEIYLQCKDVYKPDAKPSECTNNHISGRCMKLVKGKISDPGCEELVNIIVPAMAAECGSGSSVVAQMATVSLAIFMSILSKELLSS